MIIIGLTGCTASGKSTLAATLSGALACSVVTGDDYWQPTDRLPIMDLSLLPWPGGTIPPALADKRYNTNCPESMDGERFAAAFASTLSASTTSGQHYLLVESYLLCHFPV